MANIFENAKFGDRFKTRDGRMAIYLSTQECGDIDDKDNPPFLLINVALYQYIKYKDGSEKQFHSIREYHESGKYNKWNKEDNPEDIVGRWEETIDEIELEKLAEDYSTHRPYDKRWSEWLTCKNAYMAGYRKAEEKEE